MKRAQLPAANDAFSESTYGFALVNELISKQPRFLSVPIFPSLVREGRSGGGYDVRLDRPGAPLFLQFKLARFISGRGRQAQEFRQGFFSQPFYRMYVRPTRAWHQHRLLLQLERKYRGLVFYCAPAFHTMEQLDTYYKARWIERESRFVRPSELPRIPKDDPDEHWLAFERARTGTTAFFSPEGKEVRLEQRPIHERFAIALAAVDDTPLRDKLVPLANWFDELMAEPDWLWHEKANQIADYADWRTAVEIASQASREMTPLEKVVMLSQTVLNCTFCVLQSPQ